MHHHAFKRGILGTNDRGISMLSSAARFTLVALTLGLFTSVGAAQLHGRWHVEFRTANRDTRQAIVGLSHQIEGALSRCAPHTSGQASTTQVTLRFASGGLSAIQSAAFESEPAPSQPLRQCIEAAITRSTWPAIRESPLVVLVRFEPPAADPDMQVDHAAAAVEYPQESVRRVVHEHTAPITHCYETARATHPRAAGTIRVRFTIGTDGHVTAATTAQDEPAVPSLTTCVLDAVRGWTFPVPPSGQASEVVYPFVFVVP
jgi:TonB family protein